MKGPSNKSALEVKDYNYQNCRQKIKRLGTIKSQGLKEGWGEIEGVLYWKSLLYIPELVWIKLIHRHQDSQLLGHFDIKKTW